MHRCATSPHALDPRNKSRITPRNARARLSDAARRAPRPKMLRLLVAALCLRGALPAGPSLLEAHEHNAPIVYSLDASPGLVDHAFSAVASLSSVVHASVLGSQRVTSSK